MWEYDSFSMSQAIQYSLEIKSGKLLEPHLLQEEDLGTSIEIKLLTMNFLLRGIPQKIPNEF